MTKKLSTLLSICIPTYNRLECLENCLHSIKVAYKTHPLNFEVCITDNNSKGNARQLVNEYSNYFKIMFSTLVVVEQIHYKQVHLFFYLYAELCM